MPFQGDIKIYKRIIEKEEEKQLISNFKELPFYNEPNKLLIEKQSEKIEVNYDFKMLLNKINYQPEIIKIFNNIEPKKENIKTIFQQLKNYKKDIEQELTQEKSSTTLVNKKLENINETLNFIEEIQFGNTTIFENQFIFDWLEINQSTLTSYLTEQINNSENHYQSAISAQQPRTSQM